MPSHSPTTESSTSRGPASRNETFLERRSFFIFLVVWAAPIVFVAALAIADVSLESSWTLQGIAFSLGAVGSLLAGAWHVWVSRKRGISFEGFVGSLLLLAVFVSVHGYFARARLVESYNEYRARIDAGKSPAELEAERMMDRYQTSPERSR